jgi:hypothetical protein
VPTTTQQATAALEMRLAAAFPTTPIAWPNVEFVAPAGLLWLRPWVLWAAGALHTMYPERLNLVPGLYQVSIYSPQSQGAGVALTLADQVRTLFTRAVFGGVRCDAASGPVTLPEEPPWYGVAVTIPFYVVEET